MKQTMDLFRIGDDVEFKSEDKSDLLEIFAKSEDELVVIGRTIASSTLADFKRGKIIIANKINIKGVKYSVGDRISIRTKDNKEVQMFINYLIGTDALVLSFTKNPSFSSLKWILTLMSHYL